MAKRRRVTLGGSGRKVSFLVREIPTLELTNDELRILATTLLRRELIDAFSKQDAPEIENIVSAVSQKVARFLAENKLADSKQPVTFRVKILGRDRGAAT